MTHTEDYEHVLDLDNVVAVEYDEDGDVVRAFVTSKVDEQELNDDDLVANNVDRESDVIEVGELRAEAMPQAASGRQERIRPVKGGVSEMNSNGTAGTSGPYPAKIVDTSKGVWWDEVEEGDVVRLSNGHVYAPPGQAKLGQHILQPGPYDGGTPGEDEVGRLAGYVEMQDGVTVDAAARTVTDESEMYYGLTGDYGQQTYRGGFDELRGRTVVKTGRTTGISRGSIEATSVSARIDYGADVGVVKLRDLVFTTDMSEPGDSGSPVFLDESGELLGEIFAGSDKISVLYKMENAEKSLGVRVLESDMSDDKQYVKSLETTVDIAMEERDLDLVDLTGDKPKPGETITATVTVEGNYPGTAYLDVQEERYEVELQDDDGTYTATFPVEITAPDEPAESFELTVTGGYVV